MALEKQTKNPEAGGVPQRADDKPSPHRRRLIKGAVAAPAILTLHSGGVLARTSFGATIARTLA